MKSVHCNIGYLIRLAKGVHVIPVHGVQWCGWTVCTCVQWCTCIACSCVDYGVYSLCSLCQDKAVQKVIQIKRRALNIHQSKLNRWLKQAQAQGRWGGGMMGGRGGGAVWTLNNSDQPPIHWMFNVHMFKSQMVSWMARCGFYVCFLVEKHWRTLRKGCATSLHGLYAKYSPVYVCLFFLIISWFMLIKLRPNIVDRKSVQGWCQGPRVTSV